MCKERGCKFFVPENSLLADNGAMIAFVGAYKASQGKFSELSFDVMKE